QMTVIRGVEEFEVEHEGGKKELVEIRIVPIRRMDEYLARYENIALLCDFVCGKSDGWCDTLTEDSLYSLNRRARALNDPRLGRWIEQQSQTVKPKLEALLKKLRGSN